MFSKLITMISGGQTAAKPAQAGGKVPPGYFAPHPAAELLSSPHRKLLLRQIWDNTSLPEEIYNRLYLSPLKRLAEGVQNVPASRTQNSDQQQYSGNRGQPQQPPSQPDPAPQQKNSGNNGKGNRGSQRNNAAQPAPQQPAPQSQPAGEWDDDIPFLGHGYGMAKHASSSL